MRGRREWTWCEKRHRQFVGLLWGGFFLTRKSLRIHPVATVANAVSVGSVATNACGEVFFFGEVIPSDTDPWHTSRKPKAYRVCLTSDIPHAVLSSYLLNS